MDSAGVTLRQKLRLPELRLGPVLLSQLTDGYVTAIRGEHEDGGLGGVLGLNFLSLFEASAT